MAQQSCMKSDKEMLANSWSTFNFQIQKLNAKTMSEHTFHIRSLNCSGIWSGHLSPRWPLDNSLSLVSGDPTVTGLLIASSVFSSSFQPLTFLLMFFQCFASHQDNSETVCWFLSSFWCRQMYCCCTKVAPDPSLQNGISKVASQDKVSDSPAQRQAFSTSWI